jgi:HlyD family secretion protein
MILWRHFPVSYAFATLLALSGCGQDAPQALGTLEYDRIALPAPAAERIVAIDVREGERVAAGRSLLRLETTRTQAAVQAAQADLQGRQQALQELRAGPRHEDIMQAQAQLAAAEAQARDAQEYFARLQPLGREGMATAADVDRAQAAARNAQALVRAAQAALAELQHGTRPEQIAQAEAAVRAAAAQLALQQATLDKLSVTAPRDGLVDSLPHRLGDQAAIGAPLAIMLVGDMPYARVYVPEPIRLNVRVGQQARIFIHGRDRAFAGRVRMIRSDPVFTPYYALTGKDATRLSYLAEVQLTGDDAAHLPAGLPVRVEFPDQSAP